MYYNVSSCFFRFLSKYADHDLQKLVDDTVPPVQLDEIGIVRSVLFKWQREAGFLGCLLPAKPLRCKVDQQKENEMVKSLAS